MQAAYQVVTIEQMQHRSKPHEAHPNHSIGAENTVILGHPSLIGASLIETSSLRFLFLRLLCTIIILVQICAPRNYIHQNGA